MRPAIVPARDLEEMVAEAQRKRPASIACVYAQLSCRIILL
jgi:hypothetical protein